jgi:hypothetical protein
MQDPDQPVPEGPQRLVMGGPAGPVGVIAAPRPEDLVTGAVPANALRPLAVW